jgi:hypothetical protein
MVTAHTFLNFATIPLSQIQILPEITPKAMQVNDIKPDKSIQTAYLKVMTELNYKEPLKVALYDGKYTLLTEYEAYSAYLELHAGNLKAGVDCIIISSSSEIEMKKLALYLSQFHAARETHLNRLVNLDLLHNCGLTFAEIRDMMDIKMKNAAEKRQLQRDMRMIKQPQLLSRVLGINISNRKAQESHLLGSILEVKAFRADMTVKQAEGFLSKLRDDRELIDSFLKLFDEEKERQRKFSMTAEEEKKPFYTWRSFNYSQLLRQAESLAVSNGYPRRESDDKADHGWGIYYNELTDDFHLPQVAVNLSDSSTKNVKRKISIAYRAERLANTLWADLGRICPAHHGGPLRKTDVVISSNRPKFEDADYLDKIRQYKAVYFCERDLVFKTLGLKPNNFGFESYQFDRVSTYEQAFKSYQLWWCKTFLVDVIRKHFGKADSHPHFHTYRHIKDFLGLHKHNTKLISLADFFNEVFSYVMRELGNDHKARKLREESLYHISMKVKAQSWKDINQALKTCGKVTLTKDELDALVKERLEDKEELYSRNFEQVAKGIERLTSDPTEIRSRQRENFPLSLKEISLGNDES